MRRPFTTPSQNLHDTCVPPWLRRVVPEGLPAPRLRPPRIGAARLRGRAMHVEGHIGATGGCRHGAGQPPIRYRDRTLRWPAASPPRDARRRPRGRRPHQDDPRSPLVCPRARTPGAECRQPHAARATAGRQANSPAQRSCGGRRPRIPAVPSIGPHGLFRDDAERPNKKPAGSELPAGFAPSPTSGCRAILRGRRASCTLQCKKSARSGF